MSADKPSDYTPQTDTRGSAKSIYQLLGLPDKFGVVLLTVSLILLVAPYMGGANFGILQIPEFHADVKVILRYFGPIVFGVLLLLFVPLVPAQAAVSTRASKRQVTKLIVQLKHGDERQRRGAALKLGQLGAVAEVALPELIEALSDPDPHVRENVTQALEAGGRAAVRHLVVALRYQKGLAIAGPTPMVLRAIPPLGTVIGEDDVRAALVEIGQPAVPALMDVIRHGSPALRPLAAVALREIQSIDSDQVITQAISDGNNEVRLSGALALAQSASTTDIPTLVGLLRDTDPKIRVCAIIGLSRTGSKEVIPSLVETFNREEDSKVRYEVVLALRKLATHNAEAIPPLVGALKDSSVLVQVAAMIQIGELGASASAAVPLLVGSLRHKEQLLRKNAALALGSIGANDAIPALTEALSDEHEEVRKGAAEAIERIQVGELIGTISHYFAKPQVGVLKLTAGLNVGDRLRLYGHGADFQQTVTSMQLDHVAVETALPRTEVAIKVEQRVRKGTRVYRTTR